MGRRTEWTFFQRGHANGQQAQEKMLNVAKHKVNANQNHNEIRPHTRQNGSYEKEDKFKILARMWRNGKPIHY